MPPAVNEPDPIEQLARSIADCVESNPGEPISAAALGVALRRAYELVMLRRLEMVRRRSAEKLTDCVYE